MILYLYLCGKTLSRIAIVAGATVGVVAGIVKRSGVNRAAMTLEQRRREASAVRDRLAEAGVQMRAAQVRALPGDESLDETERLLIVRDWLVGESFREVADRTGRSLAVVRKVCGTSRYDRDQMNRAGREASVRAVEAAIRERGHPVDPRPLLSIHLVRIEGDRRIRVPLDGARGQSSAGADAWEPIFEPERARAATPRRRGKPGRDGRPMVIETLSEVESPVVRTRNVANSPLDHLAATGGLHDPKSLAASDAEIRASAGAAMRRHEAGTWLAALFHRSKVGGLRSIDPEAIRVDGGKPAGITGAALEAVQELGRVRDAVGAPWPLLESLLDREDLDVIGKAPNKKRVRQEVCRALDLVAVFRGTLTRGQFAARWDDPSAAAARRAAAGAVAAPAGRAPARP